MKKKNYVIPTIEVENIESETILIGSGNIDINCKCKGNGKWCNFDCTIGCTHGGNNANCPNSISLTNFLGEDNE